MFCPLKNLISKTLVALLAAGIVASCQAGKEKVESARFLIDSIKSQMVPDSRVAVFSITATSDANGLLLSGKSSEMPAVDELLDHLNKQKIEFTDSIVRLPDKKLGDRIYGLITISVANIRSNPAQSSELATQALMGTPVRILDENNGYYLIQTPDYYISHVETGAVSAKTAAEMDAWRSSDRCIYTGDFCLIYSQPDESSIPVSDAVMGSILVRDPDGLSTKGFLSVQLPDGRKGFVKDTQWVGFNTWLAETVFDKGKIADLARHFMGRPYLWGGTSAKGVDCSGYTKTLYFMSGFVLSRDASQQVYQGEEISKDNLWQGLQTGDLLFFGRKATEEKPERATHVGMYLGDSYFIHSTPSMIRINSLDSTRPDFRKVYLEIFLHAKRMAGVSAEPIKIANHPWYN
jgi:cell wall-associated NlpC family hydrolase